jgi:hypothetical protein
MKNVRLLMSGVYKFYSVHLGVYGVSIAKAGILLHVNAGLVRITFMNTF